MRPLALVPAWLRRRLQRDIEIIGTKLVIGIRVNRPGGAHVRRIRFVILKAGINNDAVAFDGLLLPIAAGELTEDAGGGDGLLERLPHARHAPRTSRGMLIKIQIEQLASQGHLRMLNIDSPGKVPFVQHHLRAAGGIVIENSASFVHVACIVAGGDFGSCDSMGTSAYPEPTHRAIVSGSRAYCTCPTETRCVCRRSLTFAGGMRSMKIAGNCRE